MKYVYPAVFEPAEEGGFSVYFPDIKYGATQGDDLAESLEMAQDFLSLALCDIEDSEGKMPVASRIADIKTKAGVIVSLIVADTNAYRHRLSRRQGKRYKTVRYKKIS